MKLFALIKEPRRDSAQWWAATRESRDGVLAVLRMGPTDQTLEPDDQKFWDQYLVAVERLSVKLDRDYIRFIESRGYAGLRGTA